MLRENEKILGPLNKEKIEKGNFVGSYNVSQLSKASNREQQVLFLTELHAFKFYEGPLSILFPWRVIETFIFPWFVILGINSFYVRVNLNFDFFVNVQILFWIFRDAWKGQIVLYDSVIKKGIARGPPLYVKS